MRAEALTLLAGVAAIAATALVLREHREPAAGTAPPPSSLVQPAPPEVAAVVQRSHLKSRLAKRIIAERTPLLEAAELFRLANGEDGMRSLVESAPGRSVREKLCRQVIMYVGGVEIEMERQGHVRSGPRVSAELQDELDRRLAAGEFPPQPEEVRALQ